jgi:ribonuclease T2
MAVSGRTESLRLVAAALAALLIGGAALRPAHADTPGRFDYWVLALSWSPQFCRSQPSSEQCEFAHGFVVHGLWPQYEQGYPEYCSERERVPRDLVERMQPLMPSTALVNSQWRKHGTCAGLEMREYFLNVERAWRSVVIPERYRETPELERTQLRTIEDEFIALTPELERDGIAVQCSGRWLREVRICLDRDFQPRACGFDVEDRCRSEVHVRPMRGRITRQRP